MEETYKRNFDIKSIGNIVGLSYILFGISFILAFDKIGNDIETFIDIIAIIIFISQRKYIKSQIKNYVYIGVAIIIIATIVETAYAFVAALALAGNVTGGQVSGKYIHIYLTNILYNAIVFAIIALVSYIFSSYKVLETKKYIGIGLLSIATAISILLAILTVQKIIDNVGNKTLLLSQVVSLANVDRIYLTYPDIIFAFISRLIFLAVFVYIGLKIRKHPEPYILPGSGTQSSEL